MNFPPKLVTVLSLLQCFVIIAGSLATKACYKSRDLVAEHNLEDLAVPMFVRTYGLWFLFVTVGWVCLAASKGQTARRIAFVSKWQIVFGLALTAAMTVLFVFSALQAMTLMVSTPIGPLKNSPY